MDSVNLSYSLLEERKKSDYEVGHEYLVVSKEEDYDPKMVLKVAKEAFPELFGLIRGPEVHTTVCEKMISSKFSRLINVLKDENNWETEPYVAVKISNLEGDVQPFDIYWFGCQ